MDNNTNNLNTNAKKKFSFKLNCIDIIIIIALLCVVCAFMFRTPDGNTVKTVDGSVTNVDLSAIEYNETATFKLKVSSLQQASGNLVKVGDVLYNSETKAPIGVVKEVRVDPALAYVTLPTGEVVKRTIPNRVDIYFTIESSVYVDHTGIYLENYIFLCPNRDLGCYTENLDFVGNVQSVTMEKYNVIAEKPPVTEEITEEITNEQSQN